MYQINCIVQLYRHESGRMITVSAHCRYTLLICPWYPSGFIGNLRATGMLEYELQMFDVCECYFYYALRNGGRHAPMGTFPLEATYLCMYHPQCLNCEKH